MGSPMDEAQRLEHERQHRVTLTQGFWLGETVVTQALWQVVMGTNPSTIKGEQLPAERVSWHDAQSFCQRLNAMIPDLTSRLPTEAEWEYACRAGTTTAFHFGPMITTDEANFDGNYPYGDAAPGVSRKSTVPVKALPMNAWGLYQMHGNVWEWCSDWLGSYSGDTVDPQGPATGAERVLRGGSRGDFGRYLRAASRRALEPSLRDRDCGFRLARGQGM